MDVMNLTNFSLVFKLTNYIIWNLFLFYIPNYESDFLFYFALIE